VPGVGSITATSDLPRTGGLGAPARHRGSVPQCGGQSGDFKRNLGESRSPDLLIQAAAKIAGAERHWSLIVTNVLTKATFRLGGCPQALTAAAVTETLGLQPSQAFEAGTSARRSPHTRDYSLWLLSASHEIERDVGLGEQLGRLLAVLEPVSGP